MFAHSRLALAAVAAVLFPACASGDGPTASSPDDPPVTTPSTPATPSTPSSSTAAGTVRGTITDAAGRPLAGVQVFADNTLYYNMNAIGVTDAQGRYEIDVRRPNGTWHMSAQLKRQYLGRTYLFYLHPDNDNAFPGADGAVRNFAWRLSGSTHDGGTYGARADFYIDHTQSKDGEMIEADKVELTFTPDGPLADGTAGRALTLRLAALNDIPLGRYNVTARYVPDGAPARSLVIRMRGGSAFGSAVSAMWPAHPDGRIDLLELEVRDR